ncbi:MAG: adenylyltransferase/cytidyltransferase family protein [Candidatus Omnitrophica bacterium]|nr:adenylyltransferase/cytidyltransferase family protein [Candidatus Omnitrophota bacterium]
MDDKTIKKILPLKEIAKRIEDIKNKGKKVVQCHGVFDIVHLGHIRHFNMAKKEGDVLLVTLTADRYVKRGPGRPIFNEQLRAEYLASLSIVDYVGIVNAETATESLKILKPNLYAKGLEYKNHKQDVTGKISEEEEAIKSVGGKIVYTDDITFSSSKIINSYLDVFPQRTVRYLQAIEKRYPVESIVESIEKLKKLKVLVIGDAIIDEYHYCVPMGKSSKEHLVVNRYTSEEMFAGGGLATANNVASLCGQVDLVTVLGRQDSKEDFIRSRLAPNIRPRFFYRPDTNTIIKRRFVSEGNNRKLFEVCFMHDNDIPKREESHIARHLEKVLGNYDLVVVSDFGHGLLTKKLIDIICSKAKYLAVNAQTNSANIGFNMVTKYPRANCVCIDELELRFAAHDKFSDPRHLAKNVYEQIGCEHIITTRGALGSLCYSRQDGFHETPAFAYRVVDAIGAGDAFFAFVAPCFAGGMPQELVSFIGNAVGSLAVQIVCNREPVKNVDLMKFITRLLKY